jgi:hypothetical protein
MTRDDMWRSDREMLNFAFSLIFKSRCHRTFMEADWRSESRDMQAADALGLWQRIVPPMTTD